MAKYRIDGKIYEANSPEEAYAMADAANAPPAPVAEKPDRDFKTALVQNSADFLNNFISRGGTVGRNAVNMALPKSMEPSWAADEAINARNEKIAPTTPAGNFGSFAFDTTAGTLLGAGPEAALAKTGMAVLPRAGALLRGAGRVARAATSGGFQGALLASPGERGTGAGVGAAISTLLGSGAEVGRKVLRTLGTDRMSKEGARVLAELRSVDPDAQPIVSHFAKPGLIRSLYEGVVANAPASGGAFREKHADLVQAAYRRLVNEAMPVNTPLDTVMPKGGTIHDAMAHLNPKGGSGGAWDRALSKYNQEMFDTSTLQLPQHVQEGLDALHLPSTISDDMTGQQLITMRDDLQRVRDLVVAKKAGGDEKLARKLVQSYDAARDEILEVMKRKYTDPNGQVLPGMDDYLDDLKGYKQYDTFRSAVAQTPTGEPGFGAVAMAAQQKDPDAGVMGQAGPLQTLGNDFASTLGDFPSKQGIFQMAAAQGSSAGAAGAVIPGQNAGHILPQALAYFANKGMAAPSVQKRALEGFSSARAMEDFFKRRPEFGRFIQSGAISAVQEE